MKIKSLQSRWVVLLSISGISGLWLSLVRPFYYGGIKLIVDAQICYIYINKFLNHVSRGVFPVWNPFNVWGRPDDFGPRMIGEFNPFLYIIPVFEMFGATFSQAYFIYLSVYFLFGAWGVYALSRRLSNSRPAALFAFTAFLFSSISWSLFNNYLAILLLIPMIWLGFFAADFVQKPSVRSWVGGVLCFCMAMTTYIPMPLAVFFIGGMVLAFPVWPKGFIEEKKRKWAFMCQHKWLTFGSLLAIGFYAIPCVMWYLKGKSGWYHFAWRDDGSGDAVNIKTEAVLQSGAASYVSIERLFTHFDAVTIGEVYLPLVVFALIVAAFAVKTSRNALYLWLVTLMAVTFSLAGVSKIFLGLFEFCSALSIFRNWHFFILFIQTLLILLVSQLLSDVFVQNRFLRSKQIQWVVSLILCLFVIIPSVLVWNQLNRHSENYRFSYSEQPYRDEESKPQFSYTRPAAHEFRHTFGFGDVHDTDGFVEWGRHDYGLKPVFELQKEVNRESLQKYTQNKFYVYDKVVFKDPDLSSSEDKQRYFKTTPEYALIHKPVDFEMSGLNLPRETIFNHDQRLRILNFDVNHLKFQTQFNRVVFLVYTDAYHPDWELFIDGQRAELLQTNFAFKGMLIPEGQHDVELSFRPGWMHAHFGFGLFVSFAAMIFLTGAYLWGKYD